MRGAPPRHRSRTAAGGRRLPPGRWRPAAGCRAAAMGRAGCCGGPPESPRWAESSPDCRIQPIIPASTKGSSARAACSAPASAASSVVPETMTRSRTSAAPRSRRNWVSASWSCADTGLSAESSRFHSVASWRSRIAIAAAAITAPTAAIVPPAIAATAATVRRCGGRTAPHRGSQIRPAAARAAHNASRRQRRSVR